MKNNFQTFTLGAVLLAAAAVQPVSASLTIISTSQAPAMGLTFLNVGSPMGPGTFNGGSYTVVANTAANQGFVQGSQSSLYAAPITGPNVGNTVQTFTGTYLSTGQTDQSGLGTVTYTFNAPVKAFALLWGSIDASNAVDFLSNGSSVGKVFGVDVTNQADGFQGFGGSRYVEIDSTVAFNQVVLTSGQVSFEGAQFQAGTPTPEPGFYGMMGSGFAILATALYRKRRQSSLKVA